MEDAARLVKWFNDPKVNMFTMLRKLNLKEEKEYIKRRLKNKAKDTLHFCIDTKDGVHIGVTAIDSMHKRNKSGEFGIVIGNKDYWSKGLGEEASRIIIDYGFKKLKLHRLYLHVYEYNPRATKLYKKLGFKREGVLKEANFWNGKFWNTYHMALLDREWKKLTNNK